MRRSRSHAGGNAGEVSVAHIGGVGHVDGGLHRIGEALEATVVAAGLGQFEQPALGVLDLLLRRHVDRRIIGDVDHVLADRDQRAAGGEIVDGAAVVRGVDDRHGFCRQASQILRHGHVANLVVGGEEILDRHRIGHLAHPDELGRDLEDLAVKRLVKMRRLEEIGHPVESVVVHQHCAEKRLLGFDIVRSLAIKRCFRNGVFSCSLGHVSLSSSSPLGGSRPGPARVNQSSLGRLAHPRFTGQKNRWKDSQLTANRNRFPPLRILEQNKKI